MQTEILIIGQGICGSFLSWWLDKEGISHIVIDDQRPYSASRSAAGLINPVTGRRIVRTWMIDELLPFAGEAYDRLGKEMGSPCISPAKVVDFFPTAQMRLAFTDSIQEEGRYLHLPKDEHDWDVLFRYELGYGIISPCYLVDVLKILRIIRERLLSGGRLFSEPFDPSELLLENDSKKGIRYKEIRARLIIFCDGIASCENPFFSRLPFAPNKGEGLLVEIPGLKKGLEEQGNNEAAIVFKKGISLAPWKDDLFWAGSSYEWSFKDHNPSKAFRERTEAMLKDWLKMSFRIVDHFASVRPATLERRPFVGFHPRYEGVGMLNGMGTKGCSLAPYFAHQLVQHIKNRQPLRPDADIARFARILDKT